MSRFVRHYLEMVAVMFIGMGVLGAPAIAVLDPGGAMKLLLMGLSMTLPMVAWMRYRGHGWPATNEMSASMLIPTAGVVGLLAAGITDDVHALLMLEHVVMLPAMLVAMLLRRDEYAHPAALVTAHTSD
jgi:hypothetical protein